MSEKDISRLAGEIADMAMNGASDEELKGAIDNSKDIIDSLKEDFRNLYFDPYTGQKFYSNMDFLRNIENRINECIVTDIGNISEDESTIHVSLNEMLKVVHKMLGTTYIPDMYNGDLVGYTVYKKPWKKLMHELGIEYYDVDDLIEALAPTATFDTSFADNGWLNHTCSNCGYTVNDDVHVQYDWNYCPNCGAKFVKPKEKTADEEKSFKEAADELIRKCF